MEGYTLGLILIYLIIAIVSLTIFYFIIKTAVQAGTKEVVRTNRILIHLLAEQLKRNSPAHHELKDLVGRVNNIDRIRRDFTDAEFEKKTEDLYI